MPNILKLKEKLVKDIRKFFQENGKDCNAIIGISGGKDSSIAAALCVEALGKDRVIGVLMPNGEQSDINDAEDLVKALGIRSICVNIYNPVNALSALIKSALEVEELSAQTNINLPPRIRMSTLYAIAQSTNGRVINTSNYSEIYIGYSTRWGDSVGDYAPFAMLTSDEVIKIGDACNIPYHLVHKVPSDGLCGKSDEENFGFSYEVLNHYIDTGVCDNERIKEKIDTLHRNSEFKRLPIPCFMFEWSDE